MTTKVRFAPSPTGYLHVGGARTALFNWLFAKNTGGKFLLRIEDTDKERSTEEAIEAILASMSWLGLDWDEGPFYQTERLDIYQKEAQKLVEAGSAYECYCASVELEKRRQEALSSGGTPRYDRRCHDLSSKEASAYQARGLKPCIRFYSEDKGETIVEDLVRGRVVFENAELDDLIIMRPDGLPTYNFAAVVDDLDMGMTHVIRGEDHLPNTPRQIQIYKAMEAKPPSFAHLSMILGEDKAPLSKRHGAASVEVFRDQGYLSDALINFLALLGWAFDDKTTLFSREELKTHFGLDKVTKSPAVFDTAKLDWMNGQYIRDLSDAELAEKLLPFWQGAQLLPAEKINGEMREKLTFLASICRERLIKLSDIIGLTDFFFKDVDFDERAVNKVLKKDGAKESLEAVAAKLKSIDKWSHQVIDEELRALAEEREIKPGKLFQPIRVAISGRTVSPPLFESLEALGKETSLARIEKAKTLTVS